MQPTTVFELDFVHFSARFSQSFDLQTVIGSYNGVFKPITGTCNRLQIKILQNSHPKNVQSRVEGIKTKNSLIDIKKSLIMTRTSTLKEFVMVSEVDSIGQEGWSDFERFSLQGHGSKFSPMENVGTCNLRNYNLDQRVLKVFGNSPVGANVSGEVSVTFKWGGEEGSSISGSASAKASDDNGNAVTVTAEVNNDGSGEVSASVSREK